MPAEGAALPLAALTAACGLYAKLRLPQPWLPATEPTPLVVYGASSAVGYYTLQLAKRSNIHPLIESVIDRSKGDTIVDYRQGDEAVVKGIRAALQEGQKLEYAFDAVSEKDSELNICQVLDPQSGKITFVLPKKYESVPPGVTKTITFVGDVHGTPDDLWELGFVFSRYIARGLEEGWFKAQPQEVVPGGLEGVEQGLRNLKEGKASAVKYIFKVDETTGASEWVVGGTNGECCVRTASVSDSYHCSTICRLPTTCASPHLRSMAPAATLCSNAEIAHVQPCLDTLPVSILALRDQHE